jgi:uncharacterized protein
MEVPPEMADLAQGVATALAPIRQVRVAYLFGSRARLRARPDSDLDVALLLDSQLNGQTQGGERAKVLLDVLEALASALGSVGERADLLDLDRASPTVGFRVIRGGVCVFSRTPQERIGLEAKIARRYDDTRPYRELFQTAARRIGERMKRGDIGRS